MFSYAEAWRRINASIDLGFYFEAIAICESIMADRILSYILGVKPQCKMNANTQFSKLIVEWRNTAGSKLIANNKNLGDAVNVWRIERNSAIHGLAKSMPGTPTEQTHSFLEKARKCAIQGKQLARDVSNWHRKQINDGLIYRGEK